jgi:hypothetical protein
MAKLHIDRSATVGWCPVQGPSLLACGTVAGAIDMSFSTSSVLEVSGVQQCRTAFVWLESSSDLLCTWSL